jgi:hypothetical protein
LRIEIENEKAAVDWLVSRILAAGPANLQS